MEGTAGRRVALSQRPALAMLAVDQLIQFGKVGTGHFYAVPLDPFADARLDGQAAQQHNLVQRAGVFIEVGTGLVTVLAGAEEI